MGRWVLCFGVLAAVVAATPAAGARTAALELRSDFRLESVPGVCPAGMPSSVECHRRTGSGLVRGLGRVASSYTYLADLNHASCSSAVKILGYPVTWSVAGKGELHFSLAEVPQCLSSSAGLSPTQTFTVTGGTGAFAGATGAGRVERLLSFTATGAAGIETWIGTIDVPGLEFDLTPPVISGAVSKTVRIPRRAKRVRVSYSVTATDAVDGPVAATCRPRSGTFFKLGRTPVTCTATDTSANEAVARFTVTVRRR